MPKLRFAGLAALSVLIAVNAGPAKSQKLPRPEPLGHGPALERDPATGELHSAAKDSTSAAEPGAIRSSVTLVQVACTITAPDGTEVRGLTEDNFRIFEDGAAQEIAAFDVSATPASITLVV